MAPAPTVAAAQVSDSTTTGRAVMTAADAAAARAAIGAAAPTQDTGWRSLPRGSGASSGTVLVRRVGSWVTVVPNVTSSTTASPHNDLWDMPVGFEPETELVVILRTTAGADRSTFFQTNGNVQAYGVAAGDVIRAGAPVTYPCTRPWPATLPGTPA